jgi:para-aminobenzoate synthetase/4-amino-4-deoxychorismate lyase
LVRVPLAVGGTPIEALRTLRGDARPFALIGRWAGGGAVLGSAPVRVAREDEDPFALLEDLPPVDRAPPGAVGGGWFGYLGYSLGGRIERLPPPPPRAVGLPPFALAYYDHVLRLDARGQWWFEALGDPDHDERLASRLELLRSRLAHAFPSEPPRAYSLGSFHAHPGRAGHSAAVEWCRRYIAAGDLYQANLCLRLEAGFEGDALDLFARGVSSLKPEHAAFLAGPWGAVASMSPELFLRRRGRSVRSSPIKGTSPDRNALVASEKDRAENVMIVDLMRNDLGKSCAYGTVEVPHLARPRRGPGVWHLVSDVTGTLADGVGDAALVRGCFPPASVTGAPKIKSMEVISQLESSAREVYTGAIGFASPVAGLELSVAIRTFEVAHGRAWLGAGGGITWGSDPDAEYRECLAKARPLLAAVGTALAGDAPEWRATGAPTRRPRPDPARGVFETVLAVDGDPVLLDEHLGRLAASVRELYGEPLPQRIDLDVPASGVWRIRIVFQPGRGVRVEQLPASFPAEPLLEPEPLVLPGGLGAHKWVDRALVEGREPLIVDLSGELLETGSGNLFIVEHGALLTPPADGRILAGVTRAEVMRLAAGNMREQPIDLERMRAADEVFVTSAIRVIQSVGSPAGPVASSLQDRLRPAPALR